jgi:hypothetical protein
MDFATSCTGLGALNRFLLGTGLVVAILNVLPMSLNCTQAMPSWLGVEHECTDVENFLNLMWCIALVGWGLTMAGVAAMPKLVDNYPESTNRVALIIVLVPFLTIQIAQIAIGLTLKVTVDGTHEANLSAVTIFGSVFLVLLVVAAVCHRDPISGKSLMMN